MVIVPEIPFRKRERVRPPIPAVPPTLVAATYEDSESVTLTFDRAIDVDGLDVASVFVDDEYIAGRTFQGATPAVLASATTLVVPLNDIGASTGSGTTLSVDPGNGIVAVDGGAAWAGVSGLALPFG